MIGFGTYLVSTIYYKIHANIELPTLKPLFFHRISEISSKDWNSNLNWNSSNGWWNLPIGIGFVFMILFALHTGNDLLCKVHNPFKRLFGHEKNLLKGL